MNWSPCAGPEQERPCLKHRRLRHSGRSRTRHRRIDGMPRAVDTLTRPVRLAQLTRAKQQAPFPSNPDSRVKTKTPLPTEGGQGCRIHRSSVDASTFDELPRKRSSNGKLTEKVTER
jgi:hypothetical protein